MKAGSSRRRPQSIDSGSVGRSRPTAAIRSPSIVTSTTRPSARSAFRSRGMGGYAKWHAPPAESEGKTAMAVASARERDLVFPEERLPWPQTIIMGLQHVMAMFGATVLVPIILGFNPTTVIFFSGVGTLIFIAVTNRKVPSYLGSSFAFLGSVLAIQGGSGGHRDRAIEGVGVDGGAHCLCA